jgi:hypothetical protein
MARLSDLGAVPRAVKNARKAAIARVSNNKAAAVAEYEKLKKAARDFKAAHPEVAKSKKAKSKIKKETRNVACPTGFSHCTATVIERANGTIQTLTTYKKPKQKVNSKYKSSAAYNKAKADREQKALRATLRKKSNADEPFKAIKSKGLKKVPASRVTDTLNARLKQLQERAKKLEAMWTDTKPRTTISWQNIHVLLREAEHAKTPRALRNKISLITDALNERAALLKKAA